MPPLNGVSVVEGQRLRRGERVGYAGQTGNASGPHLHLQEQDAPELSFSRQMRFELYLQAPSIGHVTCFIPQEDNDTIGSNNGP
jgi:hypothetical protein